MNMEFNTEKIKLVIGLGNPNLNYANTYHNVGHLFIDFLTKNLKLKAQSLKSEVYMNMSGNFVSKELKKRGLKTNELLIVHDDSDIELGKYKLSFGRGAAGHHGVENIIKAFGTNKFWRLRIGIRKKTGKAEGFVLKKISAADKKILNEVFSKIILYLKSYILNLNKGFTLIELLIYITIFTIILTAFMAVFLQVLRIQSRQAAATEVINQSQFLMQRIQQLVRESNGINMTAGVSTSTLTLTFANSSLNPTVVRLDNAVIKLRQGIGTELDLSSSKVFIDELRFTKYNLPLLNGNPNKGLVSIEIKISYAAGINNPQLRFFQIVRSASAPLLYR